MKDLSNFRDVTDVVPYTGFHQIPPSHVRAEHLTRAVHIKGDLWVGPMGALATPILWASEPRGENWTAPNPPRSRYALWRTNAPMQANGNPWWDIDDALATCVQLSRLVRPTTFAYRYACRVRYGEDGARIIEPAGVVGHQAAAYLSNGFADGLQDDDLPALRALLAVFDRALLPARVNNALWMHEHVAWTRLMNVRWPLVVTALEALVHTDDRLTGSRMGATEQFCRRLGKLQDMMRQNLWKPDELAAIYDLRSSFAHGRGGHIDAMNGEPLRLYELAESGLRAVLRTAISETTIADIFRDDTSIRVTLGF